MGVNRNGMELYGVKMTRLLSEHELNFMANFVSFEKKKSWRSLKAKKTFNVPCLLICLFVPYLSRESE